MDSQTKSILSAVLVLVAIALGYFGVMPRWTVYKDAQASRLLAQQENDKVKQGQAKLNSFLAEYKKHAEDAKTLNEALPLNQAAIYNVLNNLDTLSRQAGVTLTTLSTKDASGSDQLGAKPNTIYAIDIAISGSAFYPTFKDFLLKLEDNLRIIDVNTLSIEQTDSKPGTFSINFKTYYQK
jgi:hypothetical protein